MSQPALMLTARIVPFQTCKRSKSRAPVFADSKLNAINSGLNTLILEAQSVRLHHRSRGMKSKDLINECNMSPLKFNQSVQKIWKKMFQTKTWSKCRNFYKTFWRLHFLSALVLAFDAQNRSPGSVESRHILQSVAFGCRARSITAAPLSAAFCGRGGKNQTDSISPLWPSPLRVCERRRASTAAHHLVRRKRSVFVGPRKTTDRLSKHQLLHKRHKSVQSPREKLSHELQRRKSLQEREDEGKRRHWLSIPDRRLRTASTQDRSWEGTSQSADPEWGWGEGGGGGYLWRSKWDKTRCKSL